MNRLLTLDALIYALLEWRAALEEHPDVAGNECFYDNERYLDELVEEERALLLELTVRRPKADLRRAEGPTVSEEEEYDETVREACAHPISDSYWED